MAFHFSFTVPDHKERLTARVDNLIKEFGLKSEPTKRENGIKYSLTFKTEEEKNAFNKALSNAVPELWRNEK
ncbi:hypothetical protein [Flavobacterium lacisediminis]|uniref:Uncharacterized protein n=1 Tax=Flavobacterium lacisediminis TaxID=2989705 RepID=A0ABT3ELZ4_9FLAO|nr:hypothetical protein [Flavobacterium lacisediminis]MCW1149129.1 hypothetical protein [Flavobacterium lacisediminis]